MENLDCYDSNDIAIIREDYYDDYDDFESVSFFYESVFDEPILISKNIYYKDLLIAEVINQNDRMYCLKSNYMLIADIDCGHDIDKPLVTLNSFVRTYGGTFKVYKTKNGLRYLQTDLLYQGANKSAIAVLELLGCDPKYINMCKRGKNFMARLTPKSNSADVHDYYQNAVLGRWLNIKGKAICHYIDVVGEGKISEQLRDLYMTHNKVCQAYNHDYELV